ncbi:hypothetical protein EH32_08275 [Erythrobacter litoralis]|uniref:Uncharacterized protein n=1 Tax=Erythrobacter litoralis TaxID=39960 RepID=A0A074MXX5_9SPHN|nr:hypothetical protein EH32_08275 [Erythrobacter litoralis]
MALHRDNLEALTYYLVEGSDRDAADELIMELVGSEGRIMGRRCGRTQNLGKRERPNEFKADGPLTPQIWT